MDELLYMHFSGRGRLRKLARLQILTATTSLTLSGLSLSAMKTYAVQQKLVRIINDWRSAGISIGLGDELFELEWAFFAMN